MQHSALYKMMEQPAPPVMAAQDDKTPIYVSVRSGLAACPAIDMSAVQSAAALLNKTIEELDTACG